MEGGGSFKDSLDILFHAIFRDKGHADKSPPVFFLSLQLDSFIYSKQERDRHRSS